MKNLLATLVFVSCVTAAFTEDAKAPAKRTVAAKKVAPRKRAPSASRRTAAAPKVVPAAVAPLAVAPAARKPASLPITMKRQATRQRRRLTT